MINNKQILKKSHKKYEVEEPLRDSYSALRNSIAS